MFVILANFKLFKKILLVSLYNKSLNLHKKIFIFFLKKNKNVLQGL